ncbi:hypothetical protein GBAR_LOCUS10231 [Geodia barretti]|uniref:Uncharacterized protein n=1 Tax=Geodia barretti TaxID=519541 RepID=A0AA35RT06_GEOBA|nr:hypothetical protein GBAR_LOCUS10231 [Geodia barretti]
MFVSLDSFPLPRMMCSYDSANETGLVWSSWVSQELKLCTQIGIHDRSAI